MPKIALRPFAVILALLTGLSARAASAAEIKVVCSGAMRAVLQQLAPAFEKSSGDKLVIEYATAGKVEQKVAADEAIDVAILTKPRADRLVRAAKLVGGTTTVLARVPIGLAVKSGAPHPISARSKQSNARYWMPNRSPMSTQRAAAPAASSRRKPSKSSASLPS